MVGFGDLDGTGIAPVSKKTAVKSIYLTVISIQALDIGSISS